MPEVTYAKTKLGKATGFYTKGILHVGKPGLIEICYDKNKAVGIVKIAEDEFYSENITFLCAAQHLFLRKAGMASNLTQIAGLTDGGLDAQMQQVFDTYIKTGSLREVNLSFGVRKGITGQWTTIKSRQAVGQLLSARNEIAQIAQRALEQSLNGKYVSKEVFTTFNEGKTPTDDKVMKVLDSQSTSEIIHLGGKKLSHEETMKQYAELLKASQ